MKVGTKSLLYGCHQFFLHPIFVLIAWIKLYGRPNFPELIAIIIHDWGLWGCEMMDNEKGESHPEWAAKVMKKLFGNKLLIDNWTGHDLTMYHSRFFAKRHQANVSPLCLADKLGTGLMPTWLWVFLGKLTGEVWEYVGHKKYEIFKQGNTPEEHFENYKKICKKWVSGEISLELSTKIKEEQ